jgi:hypothetical protein
MQYLSRFSIVELSKIEDHIKYVVPGLYGGTPSIQVNKLIADGHKYVTNVE